MADIYREGEPDNRDVQSVQQPRPDDLVDTGVDIPAAADEDGDVDPLTREDVEEDPGEATRKLPRNNQA